MTDYTSWFVGMEVVCVEHALPPNNPLVLGRVYVIRGIRPHPANTGEIGIYLEGVYNPTHPGFKIEYGYMPRRFRKVEKRKTDISVFTKLLKTKSEKELVQ